MTLIRIAFVPLVVWLLFLRDPFWDTIAGIAFGVAGITDYFDGYLARSQKVETVYGKLMDPLADKFLVVSGLIMLLELDRIHPIVVILLICREMAITGLRALASAEGVIISSSWTAKWKTTLQVFAIGFLMGQDGLLGLPLGPMGTFLLYLSLLISLWSAKDYIVDFFRLVREKRKFRTAERKHAQEARVAARKARLEAKAKRQQTQT